MWETILKKDDKCAICEGKAGGRISELEETRGKPICKKCWEEHEQPKLTSKEWWKHGR